jgi:hypothetical protein
MRILHRILFALLFALALPLGASPGGSNFVRAPIGSGFSVDVPKNWTVLSSSEQMTIEASIEARSGKPTNDQFNFAANLFDSDQRTMALINARTDPNNRITQEIVRKVDLKALDSLARQAVEAGCKEIGVRLVRWYGMKKGTVGPFQTLIEEYQHSGLNETGLTRVRATRIYNGQQSLVVTVSYREREAALLLPIVDHMTRSLGLD